MDGQRQTRVSVGLAALLLLSWFCLEWWALWHYPWTALSSVLAPTLLMALVWLDVGLFIVAHDCMHGSFAPHLRTLNRRVGQLCLLIYAGFDFDAMCAKHQEHHGQPGTQGDPDFARGANTAFWPWYLGFFRAYSTGRQLLLVSVLFWTLFLLGAKVPNILFFWALPAVLSSLQLFYFGTYLPHRPEPEPFSDAHRARSNDYPDWLSLLTCFHFGYHHEHHLRPELPWWKLPAARMRQVREF